MKYFGKKRDLKMKMKNSYNFKKDNDKFQIRHIVFIASNYPSTLYPNKGTFVQQLVRGIARMGIKCSVINPVSIFDRRHGRLTPKISIDSTINENSIKILKPHFLSFSSKPFFNLNTFYLTQIAFNKAVFRSLSYLDFPVDILYGHFIYPSGYSAVYFAKKMRLPSIVACGESVNSNNKKLWSVEPIGYQKAINDFKQVSGIIAVSSLLKEILQSKLKIPEEKIKVFPNGVDLNLFYSRNKYKMRKKHGLPLDKTIIVFIGHFENRKGPQRVLEAVKGLKNIGIVFIGGGNIPLESENILFKGMLKHSLIPEMLSAGDFFVLPTLEEGSCNAIIEALACGLPVITSNGKFNDDIINDKVSITVNPLDICQIRNAIIKLMNDRELRNKMSLEAVKWARNFDIDIRVRNIVEWMNIIIEDNNV